MTPLTEPNTSGHEHALERAAQEAADWAQELEAAFDKMLGGQRSLNVTHHVCEWTETPYVGILGKRVSGNRRTHTPQTIAEGIASLVAETHALQWYESPSALIGFINHVFSRDYALKDDADAFSDWLAELQQSPGKWTVDYLASLQEAGQ